MSRLRYFLTATAMAAAALCGSGGAFDSAQAADGNQASDYTVAELLNPCFEADNDSRFGAAAEAECEQYLSGFTDALAITGNLGPDNGICLPDQNRPDEVRWAYMRWIHEDYGAHKDMSAGQALMGTLRDKFKCGE